MSEIIDRFEREFPQHKEAAQKLRQSGQGSYLLDSLLQLIVDFRADCERLEKEKEQAYTLGLAEGRAEQIENENALKMAWFDAGWSQAMESTLARAKEYSTTNEMDPSDSEDNMLVSIGELKQICTTPPQTEGENHNGGKE